MMGTELLDRARRSLDAAIDAIDWSLAILVAAFFAVALLAVLFTGEGNKQNPEHTAYASSIAAAAVKYPDYAVPLQTIGPADATVAVVTFGPPRTPPTSNRKFDIWVALPSQLSAACTGATDPIRRLQQILGLPPVAAPNHVITELSVPRDGLFRPCVAGGDLTSPNCAMDLPDPLPPDADPATVRQAYDRMQMLTAQMWTSYRIGFRAASRSPGDYPWTGFPFTGMGWSYDWSDVPNHIGISEFVVKRDALISVVGTKTPAEFCAPVNSAE